MENITKNMDRHNAEADEFLALMKKFAPDGEPVDITSYLDRSSTMRVCSNNLSLVMSTRSVITSSDPGTIFSILSGQP